MDLLDFEGADLYFDEPMAAEARDLLSEAAKVYGSGGAERPLLRAYFLAPRNLAVLVALYRFYYYQHRHADALLVAVRALSVCGARLNFPAQWQRVDDECIGFGAAQSMGLLRFYLLALKGAGYLSLRLGDMDGGVAMLSKVLELDPRDQLGAGALLDMVDQSRGEAVRRECAGA